MISERIFIGVTVAILCAVGLRNDRWLLTETKKGQQLARWFGEENAVWVLRGLFIVGVAFGASLAAGIIGPVQW